MGHKVDLGHLDKASDALFKGFAGLAGGIGVEDDEDGVEEVVAETGETHEVRVDDETATVGKEGLGDGL